MSDTASKARQTQGEVAVEGVRLHYYRTEPSSGSGKKPTVVLSHGVTDSGRCWVNVVQALDAAGYPTVAIDSRGHGRSDAPDGLYSAERRAADLLGVVHGLGIEHPILMGHSMGGETTIYASSMEPSFPLGVVLEDPPLDGVLYAPTAEEREAKREALVASIELRRALGLDRIIQAGREENPKWREAEFEPWAEAKVLVSPFAARRVRDVPKEMWWEVAPRITAPLLLVTADPSLGARITPAVADRVMGLVKNGRMLNIKGAGHNVRRDSSEDYLAGVMAFIGSLVAAK